MAESYSDRKIVVGIVSILAGGGHNALRDFLYEELSESADMEVYKFTHSTKALNVLNDHLLGKNGRINNILARFPNDYPSVSSIPLMKECEDFLNAHNPDLIVSTHFGIATSFALIRKVKKLNFKLVLAIPDYGNPPVASLPKSGNTRPDYFVVFDEDARTGLIKNYKISSDKIFLSGYLANRSTRKIVKEAKTSQLNGNLQSRKALIREVNTYLVEHNYGDDGVEIDEDKELFLVLGGGGGIIDKSDNLLKDIVKYQRKDHEFYKTKQIVVVCGMNDKFYNELIKRRDDDENWRNIIPLKWIPRDVVVKLQLITKLPILVTIAPATINELVETECGPFIIYSSRKAQELANVKFAERNRLGYQVPKSNDVIGILNNGFPSTNNAEFKEHANMYRRMQFRRVSLLHDQLLSVLKIKGKNNSITNDGLKEMVKKVVSIKQLIWIALFIVPYLLITIYVFYRKQKMKVGKIIHVVDGATTGKLRGKGKNKDDINPKENITKTNLEN